MRLFDTYAHYDSGAFNADRLEVLASMPGRGVELILNPGCELEVDGGVAPDTCRVCIDAGANVLVAGSAVYKAADIPARIAELRGSL